VIVTRQRHGDRWYVDVIDVDRAEVTLTIEGHAVA